MKIVAAFQEYDALPTHAEVLETDCTALLQQVLLALVVRLHRQGIAAITAVAVV